MHFNAFFASLALAVTFALSANADTIVAFSGSSCDGSAGNTVQCDGSCHQFGGRHSVRTSGGSSHCITFFENTSCSFVEGQGGTAIPGPGACQNVNTGAGVGSFLCAPSTICEV
ncbi:hypothetical protein BDQ12DRAFT_457622 [Crucibulum laeve]|uniref:Uncharacterized protein n=1 Tax=Crucibulum laeve TaxID=68775 RepID=A0A5C3M5G0_9AGAR|nr:hypothetical protein BDQ12DRAFT_457622 [Crucibulum laeve]